MAPFSGERIAVEVGSALSQKAVRVGAGRAHLEAAIEADLGDAGVEEPRGTQEERGRDVHGAAVDGCNETQTYREHRVPSE